MNQRRIIFHLDMNCFFAAVEMAYDRRLIGKPIAIAGNPKERRGIIVTSSYEARAYGVKTTMPVWEAKKHCKDLIILPPNRERYKKASEALFALLRTYTPLVQQVSIDEGYIDVTKISEKIHPLELAQHMQSRIKKELHLPCSIGIAPNKFLAKMASDMKKPNGITVLRKRDLNEKLWPLPIGEMYGIGKRTVHKWIEEGITTIGELARANPHMIQQKFGERGIQLHERANGVDYRQVDPYAHEMFKTIGHSTTLRIDTRNRKLIRDTLFELARKVERRLQHKDVFALGVQVMIRYHDWTMTTKSEKAENPVQTTEEIFAISERLFNMAWDGEAVRLLGISTYEIIERQFAYKQLDLFSYREEEKKVQITNAIEEIEQKYGEGMIHWRHKR